MKKSVFYIILLLYICILIPINTYAEEKKLTCTVLHRLDGSVEYYDSNGNLSSENGLLLDPVCNTMCNPKTEPNTHYYQTYPVIKNIPYCEWKKDDGKEHTFFTSGCFTSAELELLSSFGSSSHITITREILDKINQHVQENPNSILVEYTTLPSGATISYVQDETLEQGDFSF